MIDNDYNEDLPQNTDDLQEQDDDSLILDEFTSPAAEDINEEQPKPNSKTQNEENTIGADIIRGHINTIILRALYERDKYGYEIINDIESKSHGQYTLKQPTLYSALKRLENQGYIKAYWKTDEVTLGGRRKYFKLTESGKAIAEKNLSEWEYSRTIIDSLISDKSFDFANPAPTPVDFKLLRDSVSRVPIVRGSDKAVEPPPQQLPVTEPTPQQIIATQPAETVNSVSYTKTVEYVQVSGKAEEKQEEKKEEKGEEAVENKVEQAPDPPIQQSQPEPAHVPTTELGQPAPEPVHPYQQYQQAPAPVPPYQQYQQDPEPVPPYQQKQPAPSPQFFAEQQAQVVNPSAEKIDHAEEEARRRTHENYLKLISEPVRTKPINAEDVVPGSENISSDKLIYNNRPETERDYKNLIDGIFYKTVYHGSVQTDYHTKPAEKPKNKPQSKRSPNTPLVDRGANDGVSIIPSNESNASRATKTTYNKGATLLKSSAVVLAILIVEAVLCFVFMDYLTVNWIYPAVILAIGIIQFAVFTILCLNGYGRHSVRPTNNGYIGTCVIVTIIGILIIATLSFLLNMNTSVLSDLLKLLIIPSVTALNLTIFAICFKLFIK